MKRENRRLVWAVCLAAIIWSGCESEHHRHYVRSREVIVTETPPTAQTEIIPPAPAPDFVWVPGYWTWHNRWVWERGHYESSPHERAAWEPGHWERRHGGWVWEPGHWR